MSRCNPIIVLLSLLPGWSSVQAQEIRAQLPVIRQVWLDAKETPSVLGSGSWSIVPRDEFNKTLKLAEAVSHAERKSPWLLSARYEARIDGLSLTGTAELQLHNPHEVAAWGKLNPWILPLRASDERVRTEGLRVQALGERTLGVLVSPRQTELKKLQWSVQGEERSDGRWFSLQLPACPLATLQVTVPMPYRLDWPSARQHLSGPFPVEGGNARRWQLQLGGEARQEVQFVVREPAEQRLQAWSEARLDGDFVAGNQDVQARYEIDIQRWHDRLRTVTLEIPSGLQIKSVSLRQFGADLPLNWQMSSPLVMTVALPEMIEHRAIVLLDAQWPIKAGERLTFVAPTVRGVVAQKPTLRIVSGQTQPLVDWYWGDYYPAQSPQRDRLSEAPAEVVTLLPHSILDTKALKAPSARRSDRSMELLYQQDTLWHVGRRSSQLLVRCQVSLSQGQQEFLSWQVPTGWVVKEVAGDSLTPVRSWTWHAGRTLDIQLANLLRPGRRSVLTITLVPETASFITEEPSTLVLPSLVPTLAGRYSGTYAIALERQGGMQPLSLSVMKPPGIRMSTAHDQPSLWSLVSGMPDLCWQVQEASVQGSIQLQDWPASMRAVMETKLVERGLGNCIEYRIKLQPVAGSIKSWPVRFSAPVAGLAWKTLTDSAPAATWTVTGPDSGELSWPVELVNPCELQATIDWSHDSALPLISSPKPFIGYFTHGRNWTLNSSASGLTLEAKPAGVSRWRYDSSTPALMLKREQTTHLSLSNPQVMTRIDGNMADSEYVTKVEAHAAPVIIQISRHAQVTGIEVSGKSMAVREQIVLPASDQSETVRIRYRTKVDGKLGLSSWKPVQPEWNVETSPAALHRMITAQPVTTLWGVSAQSDDSGDAVQVIAPRTESVVWLSRQAIAVLAIAVMGLSWCLSRSLPPVWNLAMLLAAGGVALLLPSNWWFIALSLSMGVLAAHGVSLVRRLSPVATGTMLCMILVISSRDSQAQGERAVELVYLIAGEKGQPDSSRVLVGAPLWNQLKQLAKMNSSGSSQRWWISEARMEGSLAGGRLALTSTWKITTEADDMEIPWPGRQSPKEVHVDQQLVQPRLVGRAFGLQSLTIPIRNAGNHVVQIGWELQASQSQGNHNAEVRLPGAPVQSLQLQGVPDGMSLHGASGVWQVTTLGTVKTLIAEVGLTRNLTLSWPASSLNPLQVHVDVGVLWEHRVHQSVAHAVLAYTIESGKLDEMVLDLPANVRIKSLTAVGEVQAVVTPRIKKWRLTPSQDKQRLHVAMQKPVTGTVHLLLEMPWQRDALGSNVPLAGIEPVGITRRHGFVAYLADGVNARPLSPLTPILTEDYAFARPWLPSLSTLPVSAMTALGKPGDPVVMLQLQPLNTGVNVQMQGEIVLDAQEAVYRYHVTLSDQQRPSIYLTGQVDAGLVVSEVNGEQVANWHQTTVQAGQPSLLAIWLTSGSLSGKPAQFTVSARRPLETGHGKPFSVPVFQIQWEGTRQVPMPLTLRSKRAGIMTMVQLPSGITPLMGPWLDGDIVGVMEMSAAVSPGTLLTLQEQIPQLIPKAVSTWEKGSGEQSWQLILSAPGEGVLPSQMEMIVANGQLEQNWQFEAGSTLSARPRRGPGQSLVWSLQSSKPVTRLVIKCVPMRDAQGRPVLPSVSFPAWPGLVVSPPTS